MIDYFFSLDTLLGRFIRQPYTKCPPVKRLREAIANEENQ